MHAQCKGVILLESPTLRSNPCSLKSVIEYAESPYPAKWIKFRPL